MKVTIDIPDIERKDNNYTILSDSITKENIIEILSNIHSSKFSDTEKIWAIGKLLVNTTIYNRINKQKMKHILLWILGSNYFNSTNTDGGGCNKETYMIVEEIKNMVDSILGFVYKDGKADSEYLRGKLKELQYWLAKEIEDEKIT